MQTLTGNEFQGKNTQVYLNINNIAIGSSYKDDDDTYQLIGVFEDINPKGGAQPIDRKVTVGGAFVETESQQEDFTIDGTLIAKTGDPNFFKRLLFGADAGTIINGTGAATSIAVFIESTNGSDLRQTYMRNVKFTKVEDGITGDGYISCSFEASCAPVDSTAAVNVQFGSSKTGENLVA